MSREDIKGFISQKYNQAPQFSEDALAQVKTNNEAYAQRQEENRPWVDKNPVARLGIAAMQGVANSGLNPAGYAARAAGMDTKPFTPQNAVERATELGAEYGFDAAALGGIGKIAQGAGYLGKGQGLASKVAQEVLAPENTTALLSKFVAPAVGGGMLEGAANPQTEVGKTLANIAGAGIVGGIEGGFRRTATNTAGGLKEALPNESANAALSKGVKADKEIARQISKDAPAVYNSLNDDMSQALDKAVGRKLDIERALDSQQQRYNDFIRRNADMELYSPKTPEQQAADNFARWFEGSQIVDENGQPLKLYHGTDANFDVFSSEKLGKNTGVGTAFNFTDSPETARTYGNKVLETYLNMQNPITVDFGDRSATYFLGKLRNPQEITDEVKNIISDMKNHYNIDENIIEELKNLGYREYSDNLDGIIFKNVSDNYGLGGNSANNYVVFEPNQIKSVNNSGAWSSNSSLSDAGWTPKASLKNFTEGLSKDQKKVFNEVINVGADKVTNPKGSLRATHRALEVLNKKIDNTINENPLRPRAKGDPDVRDLMQVKERLNQILDLGGIKPYDAGISKAKSLRANFEDGYNFKPSETKFENLGLKTNRDKRAFLQGRLAKIKDNILSDGGTNLATAVKKDENTLRKLMSKDKFDTLMNKANSIEESFKRLKSIEGQADKELLKEIERNGSPWRENIESKGSMLGRAADVLTGWYGRNARKNLANAYLNPNINEIRQSGGLLGALKGMSAADTRQLMIDLLSN
jgi:hypothetical protein